MGRQKQFFHGTRFSIPEGGKVLPSSRSGVEPVHAISNVNSVYMVGTQGPEGRVPAETAAWRWGQAGYHSDDEDGNAARTWVGEVTPHGEVNDKGYEATAPSATVVKRHDIMPGRQGTFPNLNWNQFGKYSDGYNHPSDEQISLGHYAAARTHRPAVAPNQSLETLTGDYTPPDDQQGRLF